MNNYLVAIGLTVAWAQTAFAKSATTYAEIDGVVSMEAENYTTQTGYVRVNSSETSGGAGIRVDEAGGGYLNYKFSVQQAGIWYFWVRAHATGEPDNCFLLGLDDERLGEIYLKKIGWSWTPEWLSGLNHAGPVTLNLTAGTHTLSILTHTVINPLLDKIVLTRTATPPSGMGPAATDTVPPAAALALVPASASIPAGGASGRRIAVAANVRWTATASASWIQIASGAAGATNGSVLYGVLANSGAARTGTIVVAGSGIRRVFTISQSAATMLTLEPGSTWAPGAGAAGRQIAIAGNVAWTATIHQPWLSVASFAWGPATSKMTFNVLPNAGRAFRTGTITVSGNGITRTHVVNQWPAATHPSVSADGDFDGDFQTDVAVFHPATGTWNLLFSTGARATLHFGWSGTLPVPADYDGDGMVDFAVYHKATGDWHFFYSSGGSRKIQLGWSETVPVPGDYDGDGRADLAVFRPADGRWHFLCSTAGRFSVKWGWADAVPVPADYDGDGATDIGVYHPASGNWSILPSSFPAMGAIHAQWGWAEALPVPADYNGDGKADIAVFDRETGTWRITLSGGGTLTQHFGWLATVPVQADYDGDGAADLAVYHPKTGDWHVLESTTGRIVVKNWGWTAATPTLLYPLIHSWFDLP